MNALARLLQRRIRAAGPMSVAEFMAEALGHPQRGYYATRDPFGAAGDFITAPEVSQIFGELVGLWCAHCWNEMGRPDPVILAELGPGRGTLIADALRAVRVAPEFRRALRLHLVETSPTLRAVQAKRLGDVEPHWHAGIGELPPGPLLLIANEFLDALPIRQFVRGDDGWHERRIGLGEDGEGLRFALDPRADAAAPTLLSPRLQRAPTGAVGEISPAALSLASTLGARLVRNPGVALFIDYGYFPSAWGDTLQAVRRHQRHDVLAEPGEADITAHVDFERFAASARAAGARVHGPMPQGRFLAALGLAQRAEILIKNATPSQAEAIRAACHRLIDATAMGTLFKVLALAHPDLPVPAGFASPTEEGRT